VRHLVGAMLDADQDSRAVTILDMEAGLEHLSRGTARYVDTLVVTLEPYFKALETARRCAELGREIGIRRVVAVANKTRDEGDRIAIRDYAARHGLSLIGDIPFDEVIRKAEIAGDPPMQHPDAPAVRAIADLTGRLTAHPVQ
jgi:CO dehydrogenase maturation factor